MAAANPDLNGFGAFAYRYLGPLARFAQRWLYLGGRRDRRRRPGRCRRDQRPVLVARGAAGATSRAGP